MSDYYVAQAEELLQRKQRILRPYYTVYLDSLPTTGEMYWHLWQTRQRSISAYFRRTAYPFGMILLWVGRITLTTLLVFGLVVIVPLVALLMCIVILVVVAYWGVESLVHQVRPPRRRPSPFVISSPPPPKVTVPSEHLRALQQLDLELCALFAEITSTEVVAQAEEWRRILPLLQQQITRSLTLYASTNGALMCLQRELRDYVALVRKY